MKYIFLALTCITAGRCYKLKHSYRITGGQSVYIDEFPSIVSVLIRPDGAHTRSDDWAFLCAGTVIGIHAVLTAGSCVKQLIQTDARADDVVVRGNTESWNCSCGRANDHTVAGYMIHEQFKELTTPFLPTIYHNDVGIINVQEPFVGLYEVPLSFIEKWTQNENWQVGVGWGYTNSDDDKVAEMLNLAVFDMVGRKECNKYYRRTLPEEVFCVGVRLNTGFIVPCTYDTGGPVTNMFKELTGIISTGMGCQKAPVICTNISRFTTWIDKNVEASLDPDYWD